MSTQPEEWLVITKTSTRKNRKSRIREDKIQTYLAVTADCYHVLPGEHGRRVLEAVAAAWNAAHYKTSIRPTRCFADGGRRKS